MLLRGHLLLPRRVIDVELADSSTEQHHAGPGPIGPLSPRERGILAALHEGMSVRALRSALGLSSATVQAHLTAALSKTGCGWL